IPCLQHYLYAQKSDANWQLVWLNNDGRPVIGVLPKVSWSVYPLSNDAANSDKQAAYQIIKNCRDGLDSHDKNDQAITSAYMSYSDWQEDLIAYSQAYDIDDTCDNNCSSTTEIEQQPSYQHGLIGFIGYDIAAY